MYSHWDCQEGDKTCTRQHRWYRALPCRMHGSPHSLIPPDAYRTNMRSWLVGCLSEKVKEGTIRVHLG